MTNENFNIIESAVLNCLSKKQDVFDTLLETYSEDTIRTALESLCSRNLVKLNTKTKKYEYVSEFSSELLILEGNLFLPVTVIRMPEQNCIYVTRGTWYRLPLDFDIRRIVWNVEIKSDSSTKDKTLMDMIRTSVLKERKAKISHNPVYDSIRNKIVPYNENIGLYLNSVGDSIADVTMQFKLKLGDGFYRGFTVRSEIATKELIEQLKLGVEKRNFEENIKLNQMFNLTDFMFSKNEIPVTIENNFIEYMKITGVRNGYEFSFYKVGLDFGSRKINTENYATPEEAIERFREIFVATALPILEKLNFEIDLNL